MEKETFYKLVQYPHLLNRSTLQGLKELTDKFPQFHAAWMLYLRNLKVTNSPEFEQALKKAAPLLPDRKRLYWYLNNDDATVVPGQGMHLGETFISDYSIGEQEPETPGNSLIDKFLSAPSGKRKLSAPPSENLSSTPDDDPVTKSLSEDDELVTETLANIYVAQKKYDKALEAFKKLTLKYPEKNSYFASRIEEIIKLKNT